MKQKIEKLKTELNTQINRGGDWKKPYTDLMQELYNQEVLFFALSRDEFDSDKKRSRPLISTKDFNGATSLYVFSDVDLASDWMSYYKHITDDRKYGLMGAVAKKDRNFMSVFAIAKLLGIKMIMLDEGGAMVGIELDQFIAVNKIDMRKVEIRVDQVEMEAVLKENQQPGLNFAYVNVIPLK
jgi:hypothetical protein